MKKLLLLAFCFAISIGFVKSQTSFSQTTSNPTGAILNTSSDTMNTRVGVNYAEVVSIQPVITKATGTMAGVARLYGSVNGSNYILTGDTLALTNQTTNTGVWKLTAPAWVYYRIIVSGATTVTGTAAAKIAVFSKR